ncbi:hypothetical protein H0H93_003179, partial [Arthromyces matolae]
PIPEDFDFTPFLKTPEAILEWDLPLKVRIAKNREIEEANDASVTVTVETRAVPLPRPVDLDVGPPLCPYFFLSDLEILSLAENPKLTLGAKLFMYWQHS